MEQYSGGSEWDRLYIKVALSDVGRKAVVEERTKAVMRRLEVKLSDMDGAASCSNDSSTGSVRGIVRVCGTVTALSGSLNSHRGGADVSSHCSNSLCKDV